MKIEDFYAGIKKDNEREYSIRAKSELDWLLNELYKDFDTIWEMRKRMFYKEAHFNATFKHHVESFNSIISIPRLVEAYENGKFACPNMKDEQTKVLISSLIANFFPKWMWDSLTFHEASHEGWDFRAIDFHFIWTVGKGKGKRELEFEICVPNPEMIQDSPLFDWKEAWDSFPTFKDNSHKTTAYVNSEFWKNKGECATYDFVGSGWMNSDIIDAISRWALKWLNDEGLESGKKGKK